MTYKFLWDMKTGYASNTSADARGVQEIFVRLIRFFDNASALGVTRIASCFGLNTSGSANVGGTVNIALNGQSFGYWDEQNQAGTNAFAVYRFGNATIPFYVLLQWAFFDTANHNMGAAPGAPASHPDSSWSGLGIAIAMRSDGSSPWGGTTNNNGFDVKTNPVWTTGSNGHVWVWPRTNSPGGSLYNSTRAALMGILSNSNSDLGTAVKHKLTVAIDENNIFAAVDNRGVFNNDIFYFGKYVPISGTNPPVPYWGFVDSNEPPFAVNTVFGTTTTVAGTTSIRDGGIGLLSASISGTVGSVSYDVPDTGIFFADFRYNPHPPLSGSSLSGSVLGSLNPGAGILLTRPLLLYSNEVASAVPAFVNGLIGYSYDFLRVVPATIQPGQTLSGGTRLVVGNNTPTNGGGSKFVIPWTGSMGPMYVAHNRAGIEF